MRLMSSSKNENNLQFINNDFVFQKLQNVAPFYKVYLVESFDSNGSYREASFCSLRIALII